MIFTAAPSCGQPLRDLELRQLADRPGLARDVDVPSLSHQVNTKFTQTVLTNPTNHQSTLTETPETTQTPYPSLPSIASPEYLTQAYSPTKLTPIPPKPCGPRRRKQTERKNKGKKEASIGIMIESKSRLRLRHHGICQTTVDHDWMLLDTHQVHNTTSLLSCPQRSNQMPLQMSADICASMLEACPAGHHFQPEPATWCPNFPALVSTVPELCLDAPSPRIVGWAGGGAAGCCEPVPVALL